MQTPNQPSPNIFLATPLDKTRYIITAIGYGLLNQSINQSNNQSIKSAFIDYLTKAKRGLPKLEYKHKKDMLKLITAIVARLNSAQTSSGVVLQAQSRAYFKESLQLQRTEKFQTSQKNFRPPNIFKFPVKKVSFPKISDDHFFSHLQKNVSNSFTKILTTFLKSFSPFLMFQPFQTLQV